MGKQNGGTINWRTIAIALGAAFLLAVGTAYFEHRLLHKAPVAEPILSDDEDEVKLCPKRDHPPRTEEEWDEDYGCVRFYGDDSDEVCTFTGSTCTVTL